VNFDCKSELIGVNCFKNVDIILVNLYYSVQVYARMCAGIRLVIPVQRTFSSIMPEFRILVFNF